jgi:tetratricopeptide (TPR) repeat protein
MKTMTAVTILLTGFLAFRPAFGADARSRFERAQALTREGDFKGALEDYEAILKTTGEDAAVRHNRALLFMKTGEIDKAREEARLASALDRKEGRYMVTLGVTWMAGDKPDLKKASAFLRKAVRLLKIKHDHEGLALAYFNSGVVSQRRRNLEEARRYYEMALDLNPADMNAREALGALGL